MCFQAQVYPHLSLPPSSDWGEGEGPASLSGLPPELNILPVLVVWMKGYWVGGDQFAQTLLSCHSCLLQDKFWYSATSLLRMRYGWHLCYIAALTLPSLTNINIYLQVPLK